MKKIISMLLSLSILCSFTSNALAVSTENSKDLKPNIKLTKKQKETLSKLNISENDIILLDKESVFSKEELKEMEKLDAEEEAKGFKKVDVIVFEKKQPQLSYQTASTHPDGITRVDVVRTYIDGPTTVNDSRYGMKHWLDVTWVFAIGATNKFISSAATILGINASDFLPQAQSGEKLTRTHQKVYRDYYYRKYNPIQGIVCNYVMTSSLELTTTADLYTFDKYYNAVRKSNKVLNKYYTSHYGNGDWIYAEVNRRCNLNIQVWYIDFF